MDNRDHIRGTVGLVSFISWLNRNKQNWQNFIRFISLKRTLRNKSALLNDPCHENKDDIAYRLILQLNNTLLYNIYFFLCVIHENSDSKDRQSCCAEIFLKRVFSILFSMNFEVVVINKLEKFRLLIHFPFFIPCSEPY